MKYFSLAILLFFSSLHAESYHAYFGEFDSGEHSSPAGACLTLGSMIYPANYSRPVTGVSGTVSEFQESTCSTDVSYAVVGVVRWLSNDCPEPDENGLCSTPVEVCDDGLPPIAGDYVSCDRPPLKQCVDGSIVDEATGICNEVCFDYDTCEAYALELLSCPTDNSIFTFTYQDPQNFSYYCETIPDESPDNPDNGGNSDGNENNDPDSPPNDTVSETDLTSLANAIDEALQNDFGNVERAVRDSIKSEDENSTRNIDAIENGTSDIADSIDSLADSLGNDGPCDPSQANYHTCLDNPLTPLPDHVESPDSFEDSNTTFKSRLDNVPLVLAFDGISSMMSFENAVCPNFEMDLPEPINENISTQIHCELYDSISGILSAVMIIIWTFLGFRIFASA